MNELIYHNFNASAGAVGGDFMLVLTADSTIEEIANGILSNKVMWFLYTGRYRQVFAFEDKENALTIYFFDDNGTVESYEFGGDT
ncbi:MAG: hypothetical protein ACI4TH_05285 [Candidatus Ornithomonoglobus sp.]